MLEYASEVWGRQIPAHLAEQAERVPTTFLRGTLGLHANGSGVSDDALRAEVGAEPLLSRWDKLKLGFWWRIFSSHPGRLLRVVRAEAQGARGLGGAWLWAACLDAECRRHESRRPKWHLLG